MKISKAEASENGGSNLNGGVMHGVWRNCLATSLAASINGVAGQ